MAPAKSNSVPVSYKTYYRAQGIIHSPKFNQFSLKFYNFFKERGFPIPINGFAKAREYHNWEKEIYQNELEKDHWELIGDMLSEIGIEPTSEEFEDIRPYFIFELCFHQTPKANEREIIHWDYFRNPKTNELEVWVKVPLTTRVDEWRSHWKRVHAALKGLPKYKEKTIAWDGFERDYKIYLLYLKVSKEKQENKISLSDRDAINRVKKMKSVLTAMKEYPEYEEIKNKYAGIGTLKNFTDERLYEVIDRCKNVFGDLKLLD